MAIKLFCESEAGKGNIEDEPYNSRPVSVTEEKHWQKVDELIQSNCQMQQHCHPIRHIQRMSRTHYQATGLP